LVKKDLIRGDCARKFLGVFRWLGWFFGGDSAAAAGFFGNSGGFPAKMAGGNARRNAGSFVWAAVILGAYRPVGLHEACAHLRR